MTSNKLAAASILLALVTARGAKEPPTIKVSFKKIQLLEKYRSEGASMGDINADG